MIDEWNAVLDATPSALPPTLTNTDGDLFEPTTDAFSRDNGPELGLD